VGVQLHSLLLDVHSSSSSSRQQQREKNRGVYTATLTTPYGSTRLTTPLCTVPSSGGSSDCGPPPPPFESGGKGGGGGSVWGEMAGVVRILHPTPPPPRNGPFLKDARCGVHAPCLAREQAYPPNQRSTSPFLPLTVQLPLPPPTHLQGRPFYSLDPDPSRLPVSGEDGPGRGG